MNKNRFFSLFVLAVVLSVMTGVSAIAQGGGLPGAGWFTGHTVANVGSSDATISVMAYDSATSNTYTFDNSGSVVPIGGSTTWLPDSFTDGSGNPIPSGFIGSAIVSSDQPIKAIVNVTNRFIGSYGVSGGEAAAQYRGIDSSNASLSVSFPIVKYEFPDGNPARKNTTLYLQNAGSGNTTVTVDFVGTGCTPCSYTSPSIAPGQMIAVSPADATGLATGFLGAANAVGNSENIVGVFMEAPYAENPAKQAQAATGFSPSDFDDTVLVPVYKNDFGGRSTGLQVQNVGANDVALNLTFNGSLGTCAGSTYSDTSVTNLASGVSTTFLYTAIPTGCLASVSVEATGTGTPLIAATISEAFLPGTPPNGVQQSTIYTAFPAKSATTKVNLPVVKDQFGSKTTGITCQNVGTVDATNVAYVYTDSGSGTAYTSNAQTITAGAAQTLVNPSGLSGFWTTTALPSGSLNAVTVTADQPIVCIANESVYPFTGASISQDKNNYEGFNLAP